MNESTMIGTVTGRMEVEQDRLTLVDDDTACDLYINQKHDTRPLSSDETHATIKLSSWNGQTEIALDGEQLDAMIDALYNIQQAYNND